MPALRIHRRQHFWRDVDGFDEHAKDLTGVQKRVEDQPVGHEVAAIRSLTGEGVEPDPAGRATEVGDDRRGAGVVLEVHRGIQTFSPAASQGTKEIQGESDEPLVGANLDDVGRGYQIQLIDDEAVLGKDDKEDILGTHHLRGSSQGRIGHHGRALLGELDDQDPLRFCRHSAAKGIGEPPHHGQQRTDRRADPTIDSAHGGDFHGDPSHA